MIDAEPTGSEPGRSEGTLASMRGDARARDAPRGVWRLGARREARDPPFRA